MAGNTNEVLLLQSCLYFKNILKDYLHYKQALDHRFDVKLSKIINFLVTIEKFLGYFCQRKIINQYIYICIKN